MLFNFRLCQERHIELYQTKIYQNSPNYTMETPAFIEIFLQSKKKKKIQRSCKGHRKNGNVFLEKAEYFKNQTFHRFTLEKGTSNQ